MNERDMYRLIDAREFTFGSGPLYPNYGSFNPEVAAYGPEDPYIAANSHCLNLSLPETRKFST